jgi:4-amino-4-deoxy-L-arabinose transferase-like glycosyltransferase
MTCVQLAWLGAVWYSGTALHWEKLPVLMIYSLACGIMIFFFPAAASDPLKKLGTAVEGRERVIIVTCLVVLTGAYTVYACLQPGWPDERSIFKASRVIPELGMASFFKNYGHMHWLGNQHPPLVPVIYGLAMWVFGVHVVVIRFVSLLFAMGVLALTFAIARDLYGKRIAWHASAFLVSAPFFFRIGASGLSDMPMTFFFVLGVFLFLRLMRRPTYARALGVGVCIGAGLLCRYPMVLIFPLLFAMAMANKSLFRMLPYLAVLGVVSFAMLSAWLGFALHLGIIGSQLEKLGRHTSFTMTARHITRKQWYLISVFFRLPSGLSASNLPVLLMGIVTIVKRRSRSDVVLICWAAAVFVPLLLTLPGPRFFLPAFPALAMAMACGVDRLTGGRARVVLLSLLYGAGAMYLFLDWFKAAGNLIIR